MSLLDQHGDRKDTIFFLKTFKFFTDAVMFFEISKNHPTIRKISFQTQKKPNQHTKRKKDCSKQSVISVKGFSPEQQRQGQTGRDKKRRKKGPGPVRLVKGRVEMGTRLYTLPFILSFSSPRTEHLNLRSCPTRCLLPFIKRISLGRVWALLPCLCVR